MCAAAGKLVRDDITPPLADAIADKRDPNRSHYYFLQIFRLVMGCCFPTACSVHVFPMYSEFFTKRQKKTPYVREYRLKAALNIRLHG